MRCGYAVVAVVVAAAAAVVVDVVGAFIMPLRAKVNVQTIRCVTITFIVCTCRLPVINCSLFDIYIL